MEPLNNTRAALVALLEGASRHVDIMSPALEPALLNHEDVTSALAQLARRGRQSRLRLIATTADPAVMEAHRLLALARRLPSSCQVRVVSEHPEWNEETAIIVDRSSCLLVIPRDRRVQMLDSRSEAQRWAERFERLWQAGSESPELRRFS